MRVFVTGATGFVGRAVVRDLLAAGHQVVGLARSDAAERALRAAGVEAHRGELTDPAGLRDAAAAADGVIHLAFVHDFDDFATSTALDRDAIAALGDALAGSDRPLVVASGTAGLTPGRLATEDDDPPGDTPRVSEQTALAYADRGVRASAVRLPASVHDAGDHGFMARYVRTARERQVAGYPGDGRQRWATVHRLDAAPVFRLALESAPAGARLHAVGEEGVAIGDVAAVVGEHLGVPVRAIAATDVEEHFGWLGALLATDIPASSARTRERLGWHPTGPTLLEDLEGPQYYRT